MLNAAVAALACLCLARGSPADTHAPRAHAQPHSMKELGTLLAKIDERLRVLDIISATQAKQSRTLEALQDKLDRVETTVSLKLERTLLATDRLEHRLHMLQTSVQSSIKENSDKVLLSQVKVQQIAQNLTTDIDGHRTLLEKVNGAYSDTWRRSLLIENMLRDGLSVVNATRRELADGLRGLARRQRDNRVGSAELEARFTRAVSDSTHIISEKLQQVLDEQTRFVDSCQRVQQDDPSHVADVLDKLIDSLINKTAATFRELQTIQTAMRSHDTKIMKMLSARPTTQVDTSCRRLESAFRNLTQSPLKEAELLQLTEKFVALTDRADSALQRLESSMTSMATMAPTPDGHPTSDITAEADQLLLKLRGIKNEYDSEEGLTWEDYKTPKYRKGYYEDEDYIDSDLMDRDMDKDRDQLKGLRKRQVSESHQIHGPSPKPRYPAPAHPARRRHLHKHPYDRGPHPPNHKP